MRKSHKTQAFVNGDHFNMKLQHVQASCGFEDQGGGREYTVEKLLA